MRIIFYFSILCLAMICQACAGGCPTREVTQELSQFESYRVVVINPDSSTFTLDINPVNPDQFTSFEVTSGFIHQTRPFPQNQISFQFFFRRSALPGGESIFNQTGGEIFNFPDTPYDGENIKYVEFAPQTDDNVPTSYSGTVTITDPNHVQFDLTFTNGVESRRVLSVFFFQTATFDQPIGECEP